MTNPTDPQHEQVRFTPPSAPAATPPLAPPTPTGFAPPGGYAPPPTPGGFAPPGGYAPPPTPGHASDAPQQPWRSASTHSFAEGTYYAQWDPHQPQAALPPWDKLSVASVPSALAGPVGVGLGIAGLFRTRDGRRRGRGLAITGIGLGTLATVGIVAGLISVVTWQTQWKPVPTPLTEARMASVVQLREGHCMAEVPSNGEVSSVEALPCDMPHKAQIVRSTTFSDQSYPGDEQLTYLTSRICTAVAADLELDPHMSFVIWTPTQESWAAGDRLGHCLVTSTEPRRHDLTASS